VRQRSRTALQIVPGGQPCIASQLRNGDAAVCVAMDVLKRYFQRFRHSGDGALALAPAPGVLNPGPAGFRQLVYGGKRGSRPNLVEHPTD
jgi:hypothetical protein